MLLNILFISMSSFFTAITDWKVCNSLCCFDKIFLGQFLRYVWISGFVQLGLFLELFKKNQTTFLHICSQTVAVQNPMNTIKKTFFSLYEGLENESLSLLFLSHFLLSAKSLYLIFGVLLRTFSHSSVFHIYSIFYQTTRRNSFFLHTVKAHGLKSCQWQCSCWRFARTLFCLESTGDGEFQRGRVALFGWIQRRRQLPCLSERQWSVQLYLTHWQASTQLSHTFHFRVYELACMQERAHARGGQESENAHSCQCGNHFQFKWFHAFTKVLK